MANDLSQKLYLYPVRKAAVIFTLSLVFMSNTSFNQIFKLPLLIEHYREHRALNYTVTFFEFLAMHYGGNDNDPRDDAKDHSLPFKQFDQFVQLSAFPTGNRIQESRITLPAISYPYPPLRDRLTEDPFNGSSFKPPQFTQDC